MARYTGSFKVATAHSSPQQLIGEILESCNFGIVHQTADYLMAREKPGRVAYYQLVTVEILVDRTTATEHTVNINYVIKNEELPLKPENHCAQVYQHVKQALLTAQQWQKIEMTSS